MRKCLPLKICRCSGTRYTTARKEEVNWIASVKAVELLDHGNQGIENARACVPDTLCTDFETSGTIEKSSRPDPQNPDVMNGIAPPLEDIKIQGSLLKRSVLWVLNNI